MEFAAQECQSSPYRRGRERREDGALGVFCSTRFTRDAFLTLNFSRGKGEMRQQILSPAPKTLSRAARTPALLGGQAVPRGRRRERCCDAEVAGEGQEQAARCLLK